MTDPKPDSAAVEMAKVTLTFADLTSLAGATDLEVSWDELDEIAELRRIVDETNGTQAVLYSTA
jgi:hypothetical protein